MKKCGDKAKAYAQCAEGRTFSVVWACRPALNELNDCLHHWYATEKAIASAAGLLADVARQAFSSLIPVRSCSVFSMLQRP